MMTWGVHEVHEMVWFTLIPKYLKPATPLVLWSPCLVLSLPLCHVNPTAWSCVCLLLTWGFVLSCLRSHNACLWFFVLTITISSAYVFYYLYYFILNGTILVFFNHEITLCSAMLSNMEARPSPCCKPFLITNWAVFALYLNYPFRVLHCHVC